MGGGLSRISNETAGAFFWGGWWGYACQPAQACVRDLFIAGVVPASPFPRPVYHVCCTRYRSGHAWARASHTLPSFPSGLTLTLLAFRSRLGFFLGWGYACQPAHACCPRPIYCWGCAFSFSQSTLCAASVWDMPRLVSAPPRPLFLFVSPLRLSHPWLLGKISSRGLQ